MTATVNINSVTHRIYSVVGINYGRRPAWLVSMKKRAFGGQEERD